MFLAADVQRALDTVFRRGQRTGRVTALVGVAVQHEVLVAKGLDHIQHRFQVFVFDHGRHGGFARGFQVAGGDGQYHLANELHRVDGQQWIAGHQRADVFQTRYIFVGDSNAYAFKRVAGRGVDADDSGMGAV